MALLYPRLLKERRSTSSRHLTHQQSQHRPNVLVAQPLHRLKHQQNQHRRNALRVQPLHRLIYRHDQHRRNALLAQPLHRLIYRHDQHRRNAPLAQQMDRSNAQAARRTHKRNVPLAQQMDPPHVPLAYQHPRNALMDQTPNKGRVLLAPVVLVRPTSATTDQQIQGTDPRMHKGALSHSTDQAAIPITATTRQRSIRPAPQDNRVPLAGQVMAVAPTHKMEPHARTTHHVHPLAAPAATRDMVLDVPAIVQPQQRNAHKSDALLP